MTPQLSDSVYTELTSLCKQGDALVDAGDLSSAKEKYKAALRLLPGDLRQWEAATWIYVAIGDVEFHAKDYERSSRCFFDAVQCANGLGNPYIHLRLGQTYYELGDLAKSADELTRAYMEAGLDIFMEDDPKYLTFLETKIHV